MVKLKGLMGKVAKNDIPNLLQTVDRRFVSFRRELQVRSTFVPSTSPLIE
jgi:hypothetical protein